MHPTSNEASKRAAGSPLPSELRAQLAAFVERHGEVETTARLGIGRLTLARALGGLGLRRGTIVLVRVALQDLEVPADQSAP